MDYEEKKNFGSEGKILQYLKKKKMDTLGKPKKKFLS